MRTDGGKLAQISPLLSLQTVATTPFCFQAKASFMQTKPDQTGHWRSRYSRRSPSVVPFSYLIHGLCIFTYDKNDWICASECTMLFAFFAFFSTGFGRSGRPAEPTFPKVERASCAQVYGSRYRLHVEYSCIKSPKLYRYIVHRYARELSPLF